MQAAFKAFIVKGKRDTNNKLIYLVQVLGGSRRAI